MRIKGFVGGSAQSQALLQAGHRTINLIIEPAPGRPGPAFVPAPGIDRLATLTSGPARGVALEQNRLFAASGTSLDEIDENWAVTPRAVIAVDANPVTLSSNGGTQQLFICAGGQGDILDLATNVSTPGVVTGVRQGGHLDGFFVGLGADGIVKISEPDDGLTWDPTQIFRRSAESDPWIAMSIVGSDIFLMGPLTGEAFENRGTSPIPFGQRPGAEFAVGTAAVFSVAPFMGSIAWLGQSKQGGLQVYWMNGYTPNVISPPGLDWLFQQYADSPSGISDAIGWSYARDGHEFYALTFPGARATWVYDATAQVWTERLKLNTDTGAWEEYRPRFHAKAFDENVVLDRAGDGLHRLRSDVYTDIDGDELRRVREFPHPYAENKRVFFTSAELVSQVGIGQGYDGQGSDPVTNLQYSDNDGRTWGPNRARRMGKVGEHDLPRVRWDQCGSARKRKWRVWSSDPAPSIWQDFLVEMA